MLKSAAIYEEVKAILFLSQLKRNKLIFFPFLLGCCEKLQKLLCQMYRQKINFLWTKENWLCSYELKYEKHHNGLQKKKCFISLSIPPPPLPVFAKRSNRLWLTYSVKIQSMEGKISWPKVALAEPHRARNEETFPFCQREQWAITVSILSKVPT